LTGWSGSRAGGRLVGLFVYLDWLVSLFILLETGDHATLQKRQTGTARLKAAPKADL